MTKINHDVAVVSFMPGIAIRRADGEIVPGRLIQAF